VGWCAIRPSRPRAATPGLLPAELRPVVPLERPHQPARVDPHHDDEEPEREEQVHGLQDLDHPGGRAAIQVVDVEDHPVNLGQTLRGPRSTVGAPVQAGPARLLHQLGETLEVLADQGDDPQVLAVVGAPGPLLDVPVQPAPLSDLLQLALGGELLAAGLLDLPLELCLLRLEQLDLATRLLVDGVDREVGRVADGGDRLLDQGDGRAQERGHAGQDRHRGPRRPAPLTEEVDAQPETGDEGHDGDGEPRP
jgi:hypothetical protein